MSIQANIFSWNIIWLRTGLVSHIYTGMNRIGPRSLLLSSVDIITHHLRSQIRLTGSDVDSERDFIWCQFKRPLRPKSMWDLDLSQPLFHFFFKGEKNDSMWIKKTWNKFCNVTDLFPRISFPDTNRIWSSPTRRNFTRIMNDIMFSGGSNKSLITFSPLGALLTLFFTVLTYLYWPKCRIRHILRLIISFLNCRNILAIFPRSEALPQNIIVYRTYTDFVK